MSRSRRPEVIVARLLLCTVIAALQVPGVVCVSAHGGGTDSCGGHNERKNGGYHVHNWSKYCSCNPDSSRCKKSSPTPKQAPSTSGTSAAATTSRVYVTTSGTKYHKKGCRYLSGSSLELDLDAVTARYTPCSVCKPPTGSAGADSKFGTDGSQDAEQIVYATSSGKKYHKSDCRYVSKNRTAMSLAEARTRYEPCKTCNP